jgi:predicted glycoside hydrolase/deacetylase ChbG (UPF0249 family)
MKKMLFSATLLLAVLILSLPYTGLLQQVIWRMDPAPVGPNGNNLAQELGFAKNAKLLIVNSDDTGAHPTFTHGILAVMPAGLVKSTSIIVNGNNDKALQRIATIAKQNPDWGFGIHLMLTNEYQHDYPWSPVLPTEQVPSLYNAQGLAWEKITEVETLANPVHVKQEFIAQVQTAIDAGISVTHIDSHMGTYYRQSSFPNAAADGLISAAIETAKHFNLPMTLNTFDRQAEKNINHADQLGIIRPDTFFGFYELEEINSYFGYQGSFIKKLAVAWFIKHAYGFDLPYKNSQLSAIDVKVRMQIYQHALLNIAKPGLNHIYMHAANEHIADGINIPSGKNHNTGIDKIVRTGDSAVWASDEMKAFLIANQFKLINYSDVRKVQSQWHVTNEIKGKSKN